MSKIIVSSLICLLLLTFALPAFAGEKEDKSRFKQAYELGIQGKSDEAIKIYQELLAKFPGDADLLFNTGTTYLLAGNLGHAVLYMERALSIRPQFPDCRANLEQAMMLQKDRVIVAAGEDKQDEESFDKFMKSINPDLLAIIFLVFHLLLLAVFLIRRFLKSEQLRFAFMLALICLALIDAFTGGLMAIKAYNYEDNQYAVILTGEVEIRKGPNRNFPTEFSVHEGLKVRLDQQVEDWWRIWLENGLNGYIEQKDIGKI